MQISGAGFNPYTTMARMQRPNAPQGTSNVQSVNQQQSTSAVDPDGGDNDSGKGLDTDSDRGRNINIRA